MMETLTAQQEIADLRETLEYSIECGYVRHVAVRWLRDRHVAVRDAHAAERAALTEQVAQLTAQRDDAILKCVNELQSELDASESVLTNIVQQIQEKSV